MNKRAVHLIASLACLLCACTRNETPPASAAAAASGSTVAAASASISTAAASGAASSAPTALSASTQGFASGLHLEAGALAFCDGRGGRALDLASGAESARERACPKNEERDGGCGDITIRVPALDGVPGPGPDDIIDLDAGSVPLHGHVHDCALNGGTLLVATGQQIVAIDVKTAHDSVKSQESGGQVAIDGKWLAWSDGRRVVAERR